MKTHTLAWLLLCVACRNDVLLNERDSDRDAPPAHDDTSVGDHPADPADPSEPADPGDNPAPADPGDPGEDPPADDPPGDDPTDPNEDPPTPPPSTCSYPAAGALNGVGSVMPHLRWPDARRADGSTFDFDLEDFFCQDTEHRALVFILSAEWCGNCPGYLQDIAQEADAIEAAGGLLVIVDLQTSSYDSPSNARAQQYLSGYVDSAPSIRVGDGGSEPPGVLYNAPLWSAVPGGFVVQRRDMKVIANQEESAYVLDYVELVGSAEGGDETH